MRRTRIKRFQRQRRHHRIRIIGCLLAFVCFIILGTVGFRMAQKPIAQKPSHPQSSHPVVEQKPMVEKPINVAVFGVDEDGYRSDVNFVVSFNEKDKDIVAL